MIWRIQTNVYGIALTLTIPALMWVSREEFKACPDSEGKFLPVPGEALYFFMFAILLAIFYFSLKGLIATAVKAEKK